MTEKSDQGLLITIKETKCSKSVSLTIATTEETIMMINKEEWVRGILLATTEETIVMINQEEMTREEIMRRDKMIREEVKIRVTNLSIWTQSW